MKRQRGMAVLMVLLLIAVMVLLAVTTNDRFLQAIRRADSGQFVLQAKWSLLGAENWLLHQPIPTSQPGKIQELQLEESLIHYRWQDRQACFNMNALTEHNQAAQRVFSHLLRNLALPEEQSKALLQALIKRIARGALDEISQVRELPEISTTLWQRLSPMLCIQPPGQLQINVNGLTRQQLPLFSALFEDAISVGQVSELLANRPPQGWENKEQMLSSVILTNESSALSTVLSVVVMQSEAWELLLWLQENRRSYSLRSRIRTSDGLVTVTDRLYGISE